VSLLDEAYGWLSSHPALSAAVVVVSLLTLVVGVLLVPVVLARIPADYFLRPHPPLARLASVHPAARGLALVLKNGLGLLLLAFGVLMLVLPGQGVLTMLVGLTLCDFPGKRRVELWLLRRVPVSRAINWIRRRSGSAPLELPPS